MRAHERTAIVRRAESELLGSMLGLIKTHRLTFAEQVSILSGLLANATKFGLRAERHPEDPDRPADVE